LASRFFCASVPEEGTEPMHHAANPSIPTTTSSLAISPAALASPSLLPPGANCSASYSIGTVDSPLLPLIENNNSEWSTPSRPFADAIDPSFQTPEPFSPGIIPAYDKMKDYIYAKFESFDSDRIRTELARTRGLSFVNSTFFTIYLITNSH